jgi:Amt family ammonium transporter
MAAAGGLLGAMIVSKLWTKKVILNVTLNGALAGLVVITADPYSPSPEIAVLYGMLGGITIPFAMTLLEKWGIDDPVGAISVHGIAGILGLLLVPIFNSDASILIQVLGIGVIGGFVFVTSLGVWWVLHKTIGLRVGEEEELVGSDMYEGTGNAYPEFMDK